MKALSLLLALLLALPLAGRAEDKKKKAPTQAELLQQWKMQEVQRQQAAQKAAAAAAAGRAPAQPQFQQIPADPNAAALAQPLLQVQVVNNTGVPLQAVRFLPDGSSNDMGQVAPTGPGEAPQVVQTRAGMTWVFLNGGKIVQRYTVTSAPRQLISIGGGGAQPAPVVIRNNPVNPPANPGGNSPQIQAFLKVHNDARAAVGVAPLTWSPQLAQFAQQWANHLASQPNGQAWSNPHRSSDILDGRGENVAGGTGPQYGPTSAAQSWLSERKGYRYGPFDQNSMASGHYTQMVWSSTTQVGYGMAKSADGWTYVVANYSPGGNFLGQAPY